MNLRQRRIALWGSLGGLLVVGLVYAFRPLPIDVDLVVAKRQPLVVTVDEEGVTRVRDVYVLSAPVTGRTRRIEARAGDPVVAGETVLAEIQPIDPTLLDARSEIEGQAAINAAEAARDTAQAEVERVEAELDFARTELERQRRLMDRGVSSDRDLDTAEREFRTAQAMLATARAALQERIFELDRARARLVSPLEVEDDGDTCDCVPIRAPVSGRVLRVVRESEGVVQAGEALVEIGDPKDLEVVVDVLSADAVKVDEGAHVILEQWGGGEPLSARVRRIEPFGFTEMSALGIEEQRVNIVIDFTDPPERWRRLGHGYRVESRIVLWQGDDVLVVPLSALFRNGGDGEDWAVFVVDHGVARLRPVERGHHTGLQAEIVSGLEAGETIVRYPDDRITDGTWVVQR